MPTSECEQLDEPQMPKRLTMPDTEDGRRYCKVCREYHMISCFKKHNQGRKYHVCKKHMKRWTSADPVVDRSRASAAQFCRDVLGVNCLLKLAHVNQLGSKFPGLHRYWIVPADPQQPLSLHNIRLVTFERRLLLGKLWRHEPSPELYSELLKDSIDPASVQVE